MLATDSLRSIGLPHAMDALPTQRLDFVWLELTRKCNLRCSHCYADSEPSLPLEGAMTLERWVSVLTEVRQLGCQRVQFIGGEVMLVPYLEALIREARILGFSFVEVFTNATAITENAVNCFKKYSVAVATSFYSCSAGVHDGITNREGSWARTLSGIKRLHAAEVPVRVGIISMPNNEQEVEETVSFIQGLGIVDVGVDRVRSLGRAQSLGRLGSYFDELCGQCGRNRLCITADGDVLPCVMARKTKLGTLALNTCVQQSTSWAELKLFRSELMAAKRTSGQLASPDQGNCTPDCWPHGGCAPHDVCKPHGKT